MLMKFTEVAEVKSVANTEKDEDIIEEELYDCDDRII